MALGGWLRGWGRERGRYLEEGTGPWLKGYHLFICSNKYLFVFILGLQK